VNATIDLLTRFFDAINRNDMDEMASYFAMDVLRVEPEGFETAGIHRGITAVTQNVRKGRSTWAEGSCQPEDFFANGDRVVVFLYAWVRVHGAAEWTGGRFADGFVVRHGKLTEFRTFWDRTDALKWAGLEVADAA
jgi:ketosteroid isomerase-like protein